MVLELMTNATKLEVLLDKQNQQNDLLKSKIVSARNELKEFYENYFIGPRGTLIDKKHDRIGGNRSAEKTSQNQKR